MGRVPQVGVYYQRAASVVALGLWLRRDDPLQCARGIRRGRRPWILSVRPGGIPQGYGTYLRTGSDVGEIRYGVPAGILASQ